MMPMKALLAAGSNTQKFKPHHLMSRQHGACNRHHQHQHRFMNGNQTYSIGLRVAETGCAHRTVCLLELCPMSFGVKLSVTLKVALGQDARQTVSE